VFNLGQGAELKQVFTGCCDRKILFEIVWSKLWIDVSIGQLDGPSVGAVDDD
jgi:hypothetical protein